MFIAGWSSSEARRAHNPKVAGSNPAPATNLSLFERIGLFFNKNLLEKINKIMKKYNRQKAVEYARKWALGKNPYYYHFEGIGGDCTNFVSQCLLAGGAKMNYDKYYGWFYISKDNRSPSWTSVKYFERFLLSNKIPGVKAEITPLNKLEIGDIIQIRQNPNEFNHTVIITNILDGEFYVCSHSYDALDKPLSHYNYLELKGIHIIGFN